MLRLLLAGINWLGLCINANICSLAALATPCQPSFVFFSARDPLFCAGDAHDADCLGFCFWGQPYFVPAFFSGLR